jgi:hypothetical protein
MKGPRPALAIILVACAAASANARSQSPRFYVHYSKLLAVYNFVYNLSGKWGPMTVPGSSFKALYKGSAYDQPKYQQLLDDFKSDNTAYDFEYADFAGLDKMGLSTEELLWREMASSQTVDQFLQRSMGVIPNSKLIKLGEVLTAFEPVYENLVYRPNRHTFERQLHGLEDYIARTDMGRYFQVGIKFYGASWPSDMPVNLYFYPLPNSKGFTATIFFNDAISGVPSSLTTFNGLVSVVFHEMFHILYDEQPLELKRDIANWRQANPSKASHYAFTLLNEALATALGNGYVAAQLSGKLNDGNWYNRKYISQMAKAIYPLVLQYVAAGKPIDKPFLDQYVQIFDQNFVEWLYDFDFVMENRSALTDSSSDFDSIDKKWPYNTTAEYRTGFTQSNLREVASSPNTKILFVGSDNAKKLELVKSVFSELTDWKPNADTDFTYVTVLGDKTYLIVINSVHQSSAQLLDTVSLKP